MPEYLEDPSQLTKDKLKSELVAHNVELPSGNPTKDVYVQLYLKNLTVQNKKLATTLDAFSSDEELPPPVISNRSRSSGRKATRKTDKVRPDEVDVTTLTDEGLRDQLVQLGIDAGPIVASTRKLYEKKLQKLLDDDLTKPPTPPLVVTEIQGNHNGNSESDLYSDKEDEVTTEPEPEPVPVPEPEPELEPIPVLEKPARSRGKTPVTTRTRSSQHKTVPFEHSAFQPLNTSLLIGAKKKGVSAQFSLIMSSTEEKQRENNKKNPLTDAGEEDEDPILIVRRRSKRLSCRLDPNLICRPEIEKSVTPSRPAVKSKTYAEEISPQLTIKPGRPSFPLVTLTRSDLVEKIAAAEQTGKIEEHDVLKEPFSNDIDSPSGITATCRRPIRGAAGRPLKSSDLWNNETYYFSPKTTTKTTVNSSSYTERHLVHRVISPPVSASKSSSSSAHLLAAPHPAAQTTLGRRGMSMWLKLFLLAIVATFLFFVYQAMETNNYTPFIFPDTQEANSDTA